MINFLLAIPITFTISADSLHKAELYCHQSLGAKATTSVIRDASSDIHISPSDTLTVHHSTVRCSRLLDLADFDLSTGLYLDHAIWVLSTFAGQSSEEHDHQLVKNTIEILAQVGAPAIARLWDERVNVEDETAEKAHAFLLALDEIIDRNPSSETLDEVLKIVSRFDPLYQSDDPKQHHFGVEKRSLLKKGAWSPDALWPELKHSLEQAVSQVNAESQRSFSYLGDVHSLITLLNATYDLLSDSVRKDLCLAMTQLTPDVFKTHLGAELIGTLDHFRCQ